MLPISIDPQVRIMLVGEGASACRRVQLLDQAGARNLSVYAPDPAPELAVAAGARLRRRFPEEAEIAAAQLVFVVGLADPAAAHLRAVASQSGVLLNIEDDRARSDFHSASVLRRGDLTIAVSTSGRSPGLAAAVRRDLEQRFGPEWAERLDRLAGLRAEWQAAGADHQTIAERTARWLAEEQGRS